MISIGISGNIMSQTKALLMIENKIILLLENMEAEKIIVSDRKFCLNHVLSFYLQVLFSLFLYHKEGR